MWDASSALVLFLLVRLLFRDIYIVDISVYYSVANGLDAVVTMRRPAPARLRELRLGSDSAPDSRDTQQSKSIFSRVPLFQQSSASVQDWAAGDQVPGILIPFGKALSFPVVVDGV